ncbi:MAG: hypothetical protein QXN16_02970 [Candidatus Micrarchaeaceae archaeon]
MTKKEKNTIRIKDRIATQGDEMTTPEEKQRLKEEAWLQLRKIWSKANIKYHKATEPARREYENKVKPAIAEYEKRIKEIEAIK